MATLLQPEDDPSALAQGISTASGATSTGGTAVAPPPQPGGGDPTGGAAADNSKVTALNSSANFQPLLDTLGQGGTSSRNDLTNTQNDFNTALGATPTFGDPEKSTLTDAITGKTGAAGITAGQGLLNTQYAGPTGLNVDKFNTDSGNYSTAARSAQTPGGISSLLSQLHPEETQGENDFDTRIASGNDNFKAGAQNLVNDSNIVSGLGTGATATANNAIGQRKNDIGAYNTAGNNFVQSQEDNVNNAINAQMTGATNQDSQLKAMMVALQNQGTAAQNALPAGAAPADNATLMQTNRFLPNGAAAADANAAPADPLAGATDNQLAFTRGNYAGRNVINPASYLTYNPGAAATVNNSATQDQATQFNNSEALLNRFGNITPSQRLAATLGYAPQITMPIPAPIIQQVGGAAATTSSSPLGEGGNNSGQAGNGSGNNGGGVGGTDTGGGTGGPAGGEGGPGGSDGGGYARGGLVTKKRPAPTHMIGALRRQIPSSQPVIGGTAAPTDPATLTPTLAPMAPVAAPTALAHGGLTGMPHPTVLHAALIKRFGGGGIPYQGEPAGVDTVPTRTTSGEFVTRKPSVQAAGVGNLKGLNNLDTASPQKQQLVRGALHAALRQRA